MKGASFKTAELFAGIGGVTTGFMNTGSFEPVFLNDIDPIARRAFIHNFPHLQEIYHFGTVTNITGPKLLELSGGDVDGLLGCPPCQGFSAVGLRRAADVRNELIWEMLRLILSVKPKFFVLENVPALLNSKYFQHFHEALSSKYLIASDVINAAEFGLPQMRRRAVAIGFSRKLGVAPTLPPPKHGGRGRVFDYVSRDYIDLGSPRSSATFDLRPCAAEAPRPLVRLADALSDLAPAVSDRYGQARYRGEPRTTFQRSMRGSKRKFVQNHVAWRHDPQLIRRLSRVRPGECPPSHGSRSRNETYFSQAYSRLHRHGLARTITTNFHNPGSGRYTHYRDVRALTVREALRIQGFPDKFTFGSDVRMTESERLVGNAFPPPLAQSIAEHVLRLLS